MFRLFLAWQFQGVLTSKLSKAGNPSEGWGQLRAPLGSLESPEESMFLLEAVALWSVRGAGATAGFALPRIWGTIFIIP